MKGQLDKLHAAEASEMPCEHSMAGLCCRQSAGQVVFVQRSSYVHRSLCLFVPLTTQLATHLNVCKDTFQWDGQYRFTGCDGLSCYELSACCRGAVINRYIWLRHSRLTDKPLQHRVGCLGGSLLPLHLNLTCSRRACCGRDTHVPTSRRVRRAA